MGLSPVSQVTLRLKDAFKRGAAGLADARRALEEGADVNVPVNANGSTLLQQAISAGDKDYINLLLAYNASAAIYDTSSHSAFHTAIIHEDYDTADRLLERDAVIDGYGGTRQQPTPFLVAIWKDQSAGKTGRVEYLLQRGADPWAKDGLGRTPYSEANADIKKFIDNFFIERDRAEKAAAAERRRQLLETVKKPYPVKDSQKPLTFKKKPSGPKK